jgi:hypothetical protein
MWPERKRAQERGTGAATRGEHGDRRCRRHLGGGDSGGERGVQGWAGRHSHQN